MARKKKAKIIGTVGDVNPLDHSGGVVVQTEHGPVLEWTRGLEGDEPDEPEDIELEVYVVNIEDNVMDDLDWVDWKGVAKYVGVSMRELREAATDDNPVIRAMVYEDVASYHGWGELDQYPLTITYRELDKRWS